VFVIVAQRAVGWGWRGSAHLRRGRVGVEQRFGDQVRCGDSSGVGLSRRLLRTIEAMCRCRRWAAPPTPSRSV